MATETLTLTGTCKWARVFYGNRDMTGWQDAYRECDGAYTVDVDLDADSETRLLDAGSQKQRGRKSGAYKMVRKHLGPYEWAGGPPKVYKADGSDWDYEGDGVIWNDSFVEIEVDIYDAGPGKGTRLKSLKVLVLAPAPDMNRDDDDDDE